MCSACTQHLLNLIMSVFLSEETTADECIWYFLNFFLDTTIGVLICFALMKLIDCVVSKYKIGFLRSGYYFEEIKRNDKIVYKIKMKMYFSQLLTWLTVIIINKFLMYGLNHLCKKYFEAVGNFILKPFVFDHKLELIMVMIIFPLIFNAIQFWVFDEILKFNMNPETSNNLLNGQIIEDTEDDSNNQKKEEKVTELIQIKSFEDNNNISISNQSIETSADNLNNEEKKNEIKEKSKEEEKKDKNVISLDKNENTISNNMNVNSESKPENDSIKENEKKCNEENKSQENIVIEKQQ